MICPNCQRDNDERNFACDWCPWEFGGQLHDPQTNVVEAATNEPEPSQGES